jgi:hypothetical protein
MAIGGNRLPDQLGPLFGHKSAKARFVGKNTQVHGTILSRFGWGFVIPLALAAATGWNAGQAAQRHASSFPVLPFILSAG